MERELWKGHVYSRDFRGDGYAARICLSSQGSHGLYPEELFTRESNKRDGKTRLFIFKGQKENAPENG